jgi:hypothetical protein
MQQQSVRTLDAYSKKLTTHARKYYVLHNLYILQGVFKYTANKYPDIKF